MGVKKTSNQAKPKKERLSFAGPSLQVLEQHLRVQATLALEYVKTLNNLDFDEKQAIMVATSLFGFLHDIGKTSNSWQDIVVQGKQGKKKKAEHEILGPALLSRLLSNSVPFLKKLKESFPDNYELGKSIAIRNMLYHHARSAKTRALTLDIVKATAGNAETILNGFGLFKHDYNSEEIRKILQIQVAEFLPNSAITDEVFMPRFLMGTQLHCQEEVAQQHSRYIKQNSLLLSSRYISISIDRFISGLSPEQLTKSSVDLKATDTTNLLTQFQESLLATKDSFDFEVSDKTLSTEQGKAQIRAANHFTGDFGVVGANANFGKTLTTLLLAQKLRVKKIIYVCPSIMVMRSIFSDMISNKNKHYSYGLKNGSRIGWLSSSNALKDEESQTCILEVSGDEIKRVHDDIKFSECDVIIMTTDRFCNTLNELGSQVGPSQIFRDALVVADEWHQVVETPYQIHELFSGLKSLRVLSSQAALISATTNLELLNHLGIHTTFKGTLVDPTNENQYEISVVPTSAILSPKLTSKREARIYTKTDDAKIDTLKDILAGLETRLVTSDVDRGFKDETFTHLTDDFGTNSDVDNVLLRSGPIVKSSLPISFENAKMMLNSPEDMMQILTGRVNRKKDASVLSKVEICVGDDGSSESWIKTFLEKSRSKKEALHAVSDKKNNQHLALFAKSGGNSNLLRDGLEFLSFLLKGEKTTLLTTTEIFTIYDEYIRTDRYFYSDYIQNILNEGMNYLTKNLDLVRTRRFDVLADFQEITGKKIGWRGGSKLSKLLIVNVKEKNGKFVSEEIGYSSVFSERNDFGDSDSKNSPSRAWESETLHVSRKYYHNKEIKDGLFMTENAPIMMSLSDEDISAVTDESLKMTLQSSKKNGENYFVYVVIDHGDRKTQLGRMELKTLNDILGMN